MPCSCKVSASPCGCGTIAKSVKPAKASQSESNTLPEKDCKDGFPIDKYSSYIRGVNKTELLYSLWNSYQNTIGAKFTQQQDIIGAPVTPDVKGPANIFVIRHGEKNPVGEPNYSLNQNGIYRSCELMNFVNKLARDGTPISYIVTCNSCPYDKPDPSMRPIHTVSMVSFMLNIPIFIFGSSLDFAAVVKNLFNSGIFDGLNVLICWEHTAIQRLCLNLLDGAGKKNRLPNKCKTGDEFFKIKNPCPQGNYKCNDKTSPYYPPEPGTVPGVGANTQYYPYWNTNDFDSVFWLKSNPKNYIFDFKIFEQSQPTCFSSCNLHVGLYQPLLPNCDIEYVYINEDACDLPPSSWKTT